MLLVFNFVIIASLLLKHSTEGGKNPPKVKWLPGEEVHHRLLHQAGNWSDTEEYIGRATFFGGVIPGKIDFNQKKISFMFKGESYKKDKYEVLVFDLENLHWAPLTGNEDIPENSFESGCDPSGHPIFICRALQENYVTVGTISSLEKNCSTAFAPVPQMDIHYEILVKREDAKASIFAKDEMIEDCNYQNDPITTTSYPIGFSMSLVILSILLFIFSIIGVCFCNWGSRHRRR